MGTVYYNIHYSSVAQCHTKMANYSVLLVYTIPIPHCNEPLPGQYWPGMKCYWASTETVQCNGTGTVLARYCMWGYRASTVL